ncbi:hypothetical protein BHE74_00042565, partial [Ensete ventricosum]
LPHLGLVSFSLALLFAAPDSEEGFAKSSSIAPPLISSASSSRRRADWVTTVVAPPPKEGGRDSARYADGHQPEAWRRRQREPRQQNLRSSVRLFSLRRRPHLAQGRALLSMLASQSQSRYLEPESRDWRGRSGQSTSFGDERSWDTIRENKESNNLNSGHQEIRQLNKQGSQFSSNTQVSSIQAVIY